MATLTKDQEIARTMKRWYSDPWAAIREGKIFTLDQTDARTPVKQFPPKQHLEQITRIFPPDLEVTRS